MSNNWLSRIAWLTLLIGCVSCSAKQQNKKPLFLADTIIKTYYDGKQDDLLTAGWSYQQLALRKLPTSNQPIDSNWLRRAAYFNNITALIDTTEAGGYGVLYGPKKEHSAVSGFEYLSYSVDQSEQLDASLMVQIPDNMNLKTPCIIVAASSGSRGIYGAVGTVGLWALTKGCAVAYTDKGTGSGFYFFDSNKGYDLQGIYQPNKKKALIYSEQLNDKKRAFLKKHPTAIATKQAYSKKNIEKDFGKFVIQAAEFALYQINQHFSESAQHANIAFNKKNTLIVAASISNGGVSSLKAGELDSKKLFDGIVAAEPNIYPKKNSQLTIFEAEHEISQHSIAAFDYFAAINLYSPCALLTTQAQTAPFANPSKAHRNKLANWCEQLKADELIQGETIDKLANHSLKKLTDLGIAENQQTLSPLMEAINLWPALAVTYSNQLGRYSIEDNLCGVYFSTTDPTLQPIEMTEQTRILLSAMSNGIPPTAGINLVSSNSFNGYQQAKCFYQQVNQTRVQQGVKELTAESNLNGIPTIILHGRNDSLIQPNHSSRPYFANVTLNHQDFDGNRPNDTNIRYYEITNAQHFDAFNTLPQFSNQFIPLHYYFEQSLDLMFDHLEANKPLPDSQVIHTNKRKTENEQLEGLQVKHLPAIGHQSSSLINLMTDKNGHTNLIIPR